MIRRCPECTGGRVPVYADQGDGEPIGDADCDRCGGTGEIEPASVVLRVAPRPLPVLTDEELDALLLDDDNALEAA